MDCALVHDEFSHFTGRLESLLMPSVILLLIISFLKVTGSFRVFSLIGSRVSSHSLNVSKQSCYVCSSKQYLQFGHTLLVALYTLTVRLRWWLLSSPSGSLSRNATTFTVLRALQHYRIVYNRRKGWFPSLKCPFVFTGKCWQLNTWLAAHTIGWFRP